jgi:geranylgeranyl pyrophosphate synthase
MLDYYGILIEDRLKEFLKEILQEARAYHPFIERAYSRFEDYIFRKGKRLASCSTLLTYIGYTGKMDDRILDVAVGIEIFRHCILIHDDLVDQDDLRRGKKTVHKMFSEGQAKRFGEGVAIFLGDISYTLAIRAILNSGFEDEKLKKILSILSEGYKEVNESQILDLLFEIEEVDAKEWYTMASKRAASLFKITMLIGAVLGGAPERDLNLLEKAAINIGYAFDIQDDIIDTYASKNQYGRHSCRDLRLCKKPLHVIYTLLSKNQKSSELLRNLLGKKLNKDEIELARLAIKNSGSLRRTNEMSKKHAEKAKELILKTNLNEEIKNFFKLFINYIEESLSWYK